MKAVVKAVVKAERHRRAGPRLSEAARAEDQSAEPAARGGPQRIPRPPTVRPGPDAPWSTLDRITTDEVRDALVRRGPPDDSATDVPVPELPGQRWRPAAVLCALFDGGGPEGAEVVLTRRSARLRSHTHEVSFPGGRIDAGEQPEEAALREAKEEVGIDPSSVEVIGRLGALRTVLNPAPILPFIGVLPARPILVANPAEVERVFSVSLAELTRPGVFHSEQWVLPDGHERPIHFFELIGDTVWGATARMLYELIELVGSTRPR